MGYAVGTLAGTVSALILFFALAHSGSPAVLAVYLATVPLFMAGLGMGTISGLIAAIVGTAGLLAFSPPSYGFFYVVADALPAIGLVFMALRHRATPDGKTEWSSEGHLLAALAIYPCFIFLGIYAATMDHPGGLLALTQDAFDGISAQVTAMLSDNGQEVTPEVALKVHQILALFARMTPAMGMCAWLFSTLIAMGAAQLLLRQQKRNLRPAFALDHLHVPTWVIFAAAATGLTASLAPAPYDYIGLNLSIILGVPFFFVGLAVVHAAAAQTRAATAILVLFYIVISIIPHVMLLVALLGAVDQWVDFRKRFAGRPLP